VEGETLIFEKKLGGKSYYDFGKAKLLQLLTTTTTDY
jgi:hypothetical protein